MGSITEKDYRKLITVVIPNYNGEKFLAPCLDSVLSGGCKAEVIVVDNGSTDKSCEIIEKNYPGVRLLKLKGNTGFAHAANAGLMLTRTRFAFLLNNDTTIDGDCIEKLYEALTRDPRAFSVQAKMLSMRDPGKIDDAGDYYCALGWAFPRGKGKPADRYNQPGRIFSACAGAAMYRMDVIEEIGYFDERHFCYLEDVDLGYRAKVYGYRNLYEPKAIVYHYGSASSGSAHNPFKEGLVPGNNAYLLHKNMPVLQYALNAPLIAAGRFIKRRYFAQKGLGEAYNKGLERGTALKEKEKYAMAAAAYGEGPVKDPVPYEAMLSEFDERTADMLPLYLGEKTAFELRNLPGYLKIQGELWANLVRRVFG